MDRYKHTKVFCFFFFHTKVFNKGAGSYTYSCMRTFIYFLNPLSTPRNKSLKKIRQFWNRHWGEGKGRELTEVYHTITTYYQQPKIWFHKFRRHQSAWFYDFYQLHLETWIRKKLDGSSDSRLDICKKVQSKDRMWKIDKWYSTVLEGNEPAELNAPNIVWLSVCAFIRFIQRNNLVLNKILLV